MLRKDDCFTTNTWITWLAADIDRCSANQRAIGVTRAGVAMECMSLARGFSDRDTS